MTEKETQAQNTSQPHVLSKPERRSGGLTKRTFSLMMLLAGILVLLSGGGLLLWQLTTHSGNSNGTGTQPVLKATSTGSNACGPRLPWNVIQQELASELHLTVSQVQGKIRTGKTIQDVASEQGFTQAQLHTFELHAYQVGNEQWKGQGCLTQQDFVSNQQRYSSETPQMLNDDFTSQFAQ